MQSLNRVSGAAFALLLALPAFASAQTPPSPTQAQQCTARAMPASVQAGSAAVQVTVTLSEALGPVTGLKADDSGIKTASASDIPRTEMSASGGTPAPIRMGEGQNTWIIWLNTTAAEPGSHDLALTAGEGTCTAHLTVQPAS